MISRLSTASWLLLVPSIQGTRHTFDIRTSKSLIGPVGVPFGFNDHGYVTLNVAKFSLDPVDGDTNIVGQVEAGFLLQRFKNEADFYQFMDGLQTNTSTCAFEHFLEANDYRYDGADYNDDVFSHDDDAYGHSAIQSAEHGILLSMNSKDRSIEYRFKK